MFNSNIEYEKNERYLTGFSCLYNIMVIETSFIIFNILHNMETHEIFIFVLFLPKIFPVNCSQLNNTLKSKSLQIRI